MLAVNDDRLIHSDASRGLSVLAKPACSDAFLALLEQTEFGTSGLRYRRLGVSEQLARLPDPVYFELRERDALIGTYAVACSPVTLSGDAADGLYRGLLAVHPGARGAGKGRYFLEQVLHWLGERAVDLGSPAIAWGCIERRNDRSLALLRSLGARSVGTLETLMTYSQWPRERIDVDTIDDPDLVAGAIARSAADCGLRRVGRTAAPFHAVARGSEILVGAHATVTTIDLVRSGGILESMFDRLMAWVPAARRRYNPHYFRYLRLADVVIAPDTAGLWPEFLTTLLARHDAHMAMFMLDPRSEAYSLLSDAGVFGRFAASTRQHVEVLAQAWNTPAGLLDELVDRPIAIGPLDI